MRLDQFIAYLAADLQTWTEAEGGKFHVARDPLHPYVILAGGNFKSFAVILSFAGSQGLNRDEHPHGMEAARADVFIGHGIDLRTNPGAWLFQAYGADDPILQRLSALRDRLLTIVFSNGANRDDAYAENEGIEQVTLPDGTTLRAFKQTVSWPIEIEVTVANYRYLP